MIDIETAIEHLADRAWALHKRLGENYGSQVEQWADMKRLGELGAQLLKLAEARHVVRVVERDIGSKREAESATAPSPNAFHAWVTTGAFDGTEACLVCGNPPGAAIHQHADVHGAIDAVAKAASARKRKEQGK